MYKKFIKRILDFTIALFSLLLISPLLLIVIVLLFIINNGSGVFFTQSRPGYKGKIFKIIKFKTMNNKRDAEGNLLPDIQRITKFGAVMRKFSIDELPQLINVLIGNMSIVGPRPLLVQYLPLYSAEQVRRHDVRPGITGWSQVNGRNNISWSKKFELDVWYVDNVSFLLDCRIMWLTIKRVIKHSDIDNTNVDSKKYTTPLFNGNN